MKISAAIIAKNEAKMLEACLKTLKWANEVILVDGGSTDGTVEIAKKHGAKVVRDLNSKDFAARRNRALKEVGGDWVFYIDADERVNAELQSEIELRIMNHEARINAYAIPRKNYIFGKEFKYGGQRPDYVKRLFLKAAFKGWTGALHEEPHFAGELGHLTNYLVHIKHETIGEMVDKTNNWSEIEAKLMYDAGHPNMNILRFAGAMVREFWLRMIVQAAFLDGTEGIIYALYQVFSRVVSYTKLWEMQVKTNN